MRDAQSDPTTHLSLRLRHRGRGSDVVEAADNAETASGQCDGRTDQDAISWIRSVRDENRIEAVANVLMSHHTGAQLITFPLHTIEFTNRTVHMIAVQIMNMHVPTFHDSKCQYKGTTESMIAIPEKTVNTVLEAVILARCVS